jgi:3-phosphoglycerate kinase
MLEQLRAGVPFEEFARSQHYDLKVELGANRRSSTVPQDILRRIFELPPPLTDKTTTDFIETANGDVVIVELLRVSPGEYKSLPEEEKQQLHQLLMGEFASLINDDFQSGLRARAEITVL